MIEQSDVEIAKAEVRERFANLAHQPIQEGRFEIGASSVKRLGYDSATIDALPLSGTESVAGIGNPLGVAALAPAGRLAIADMLLEAHVTPEELAELGSWSD